MDFTDIKNAFEKKGYIVTCFETAAQAAEYLNEQIDNVTVAFGGSMTIKDMGLSAMLKSHNTFYSHWDTSSGLSEEEAIRRASTTEVYLSSANAMSKTGEIVNIDGTGNRVSSLAFGHKRVYYVVGKNKIADNLDAAIDRARNIASPLNAKRLNRKTPCVVDMKCHDCNSPERICRGMFITLVPMRGVQTEIVLINEDLGY